MDEHKYMVRVSCMTYNHASYIEDAMNGFCMQETSFPFVCTIVDDASTDGEQDVIQKYLNEHFVLTLGPVAGATITRWRRWERSIFSSTFGCRFYANNSIVRLATQKPQVRIINGTRRWTWRTL